MASKAKCIVSVQKIFYVDIKLFGLYSFAKGWNIRLISSVAKCFNFLVV